MCCHDSAKPYLSGREGRREKKLIWILSDSKIHSVHDNGGRWHSNLGEGTGTSGQNIRWFDRESGSDRVYQRYFSQLTMRVEGKWLVFQRVRSSGVHCCVPLCNVSSRYNTKVSFHSFPIDPVVWAEWKKKIRRENFSPTKHKRVCSRHFKQTDFDLTANGLKRMKKGTVPVLFAWNGYELLVPRLSVCGLPPGARLRLRDGDWNASRSRLLCSPSNGTKGEFGRWDRSFTFSD